MRVDKHVLISNILSKFDKQNLYMKMISTTAENSSGFSWTLCTTNAEEAPLDPSEYVIPYNLAINLQITNYVSCQYIEARR
jgi:hypothetical protein